MFIIHPFHELHFINSKRRNSQTFFIALSQTRNNKSEEEIKNWRLYLAQNSDSPKNEFLLFITWLYAFEQKSNHGNQCTIGCQFQEILYQRYLQTFAEIWNWQALFWGQSRVEIMLHGRRLNVLFSTISQQHTSLHTRFHAYWRHKKFIFLRLFDAC